MFTIFTSDCKSRLLNRFLIFEKAVIFGHGHFRSFSKMIRSFGSIVYINNYLYNTIGEICAPENENDRK